MALLLVLAGLVAPPGAGAQQQHQQPPPPPLREVAVQNETDMTLQNLYLHPPGAANRGLDRLGSEVVAPGTVHRARLGRLRDCVFDVVAVWQDGTEETRRRVDICRSPRLVYGDPAMPTLEVEVANRSQVVLRELYASTRGAEAWGPDRLGATVIAANGSFRLRMRTRDCTFDLRAVYEDEREEVKTRLDLCADRRVAFDRSTIPAPAARTVVLVNRHLAAVQEVYISSSTDNDWGPDRLGTDTLPQEQEA
jgi:hypothetical protein